MAVHAHRLPYLAHTEALSCYAAVTADFYLVTSSRLYQAVCPKVLASEPIRSPRLRAVPHRLNVLLATYHDAGERLLRDHTGLVAAQASLRASSACTAPRWIGTSRGLIYDQARSRRSTFSVPMPQVRRDIEPHE